MARFLLTLLGLLVAAGLTDSAALAGRTSWATVNSIGDGDTIRVLQGQLPGVNYVGGRVNYVGG